MSFNELTSSVGWLDGIDVLAVALIVYMLLLRIRGTRAVQFLLGMLVLYGISFLAKGAGLLTLERLLQGLFVLIPFASIVLFQDQIRRAVATFGDTSLLGLGSKRDVEQTISEIVRAAGDLVKRKIGAILVVEGQQGLRDLTDRGTLLDAEISRDLLVNIFSPGAPLHDGAVILRADRVAAAGCVLPLTRQMGVGSDLGTRHRAAIGVSEQTDALALVVSEETGEISVAKDGKLERGIDSGRLLTLLREHISRSSDVATKELGAPAEAPGGGS